MKYYRHDTRTNLLEIGLKTDSVTFKNGKIMERNEFVSNLVNICLKSTPSCYALNKKWNFNTEAGKKIQENHYYFKAHVVRLFLYHADPAGYDLKVSYMEEFTEKLGNIIDKYSSMYYGASKKELIDVTDCYWEDIAIDMQYCFSIGERKYCAVLMTAAFSELADGKHDAEIEQITDFLQEIAEKTYHEVGHFIAGGAVYTSLAEKLMHYILLIFIILAFIVAFYNFFC